VCRGSAEAGANAINGDISAVPFLAAALDRSLDVFSRATASYKVAPEPKLRSLKARKSAVVRIPGGKHSRTPSSRDCSNGNPFQRRFTITAFVSPRGDNFPSFHFFSFSSFFFFFFFFNLLSCPRHRRPSRSEIHCELLLPRPSSSPSPPPPPPDSEMLAARRECHQSAMLSDLYLFTGPRKA